MIRILHVMGCSDAGGISSVVRTLYQFTDREKIHFDIALTIPEEGQNSRYLESLGAEIFHIPMKGEDRQGFCRELTRLLETGEYDGIHVHESETCYVALRLAKQLGIPCRIAHAHTSSPYEGPRSVVRRLSGCLLNYPSATHVLACGEKAGRRVFGRLHMKGKKALVLPNAVDTEKFSFDPALRSQVRRELGLGGELVLGMVARLSEEKNVIYAPRVLKEVLKLRPDARLVIAGNGPEEDRVRKEIRDLGLSDRVSLLGRRSDVERLYQAFDAVLMPSIHEGFPVVAVEALSAGLPVLLSDTITRELQSFQGVSYLPLSRITDWAEQICRLDLGADRLSRGRQVKKMGLDIRETARLLERIYEEDTGKRES